LDPVVFAFEGHVVGAAFVASRCSLGSLLMLALCSYRQQCASAYPVRFPVCSCRGSQSQSSWFRPLL